MIDLRSFSTGMSSRPVLFGAGPPSPRLRCRRLEDLTQRKTTSFLIGRRPLPFTTRTLRDSRKSRDRCLLRAVSAASAASVADQVPQSSSHDASNSPLGRLSRTWHSYWSLGRPQKQQQDKNPKKLRKISSKLWSIMDVNGYLLTAALFCMVSSVIRRSLDYSSLRTQAFALTSF